MTSHSPQAEAAALIAEANDWRAESPDDPNTEIVSERVTSLIGRLADALDSATAALAVKREADREAVWGSPSVEPNTKEGTDA